MNLIKACDLNQAGYLSQICYLIQVGHLTKLPLNHMGHLSQLVSESRGSSESVNL